MKSQRLVFLVVFISVLFLVTFFFTSSITGMVIQTMYCDNDECREFCSSDADCDPGQACCDNNGYGVCGDGCETLFTAEAELESIPEVETPGTVTYPLLWLYISLIAITLMIGIVFLLSDRK
ncbi:MAG: hypothetical protein KJ709_08310 [Nanoarchaeota archaeon]|nr:hypothetical protein [Nanoarchaeota archaeon]